MLVPSPIRFSIDTIHKNMMLVTIISLLLVIIFMLCLHLYARWYFSLAHQRSQTTFPEPYVLRSRLHRRFPATSSSSSRWGLPLSVIASLPVFIHKSPPSSNSDYVVECAICLSVFLEEEIGRKLPGCGHVFHVDCIDMWLYSHSTCPICRSLILCHYDNHIAEYIEIDLLDQEGELELEIHNPQNSPVQASRKTTNMVLQVDSGPGCSSSSG